MLNAICNVYSARSRSGGQGLPIPTPYQIPFFKEIGVSNSNARPSVRRSVACRSEPGIQIKAALPARTRLHFLYDYTICFLNGNLAGS